MRGSTQNTGKRGGGRRKKSKKRRKGFKTSAPDLCVVEQDNESEGGPGTVSRRSQNRQWEGLMVMGSQVYDRQDGSGRSGQFARGHAGGHSREKGRKVAPGGLD